MLNAVLFIADPHLAALMRDLAGKSNEFAIGSIIELADTRYSVERTLNTTTPDVLLMEMSDFDRDVSLAAAIHQYAPDVPLVGLVARNFQERLSSSSNQNLTSLVSWPFTVGELERAISSAVHTM